MNIKSRLRKLESTRPNRDSCQCPDAIAYAATPYFKTCYQCGKGININTWKGWNLIEPTLETDNFAFALARLED